MRYPDPRKIAEKCVRRAMAAESDYEAGVRDPAEDWERNTKDAEDRYEAGLKEAMGRKAFGKGVTKAGTAKQQTATIQKGVEQGRWRDGISVATEDIAAAQEPIASKMRAITLPPKGPKGSPQNVKRFEVVRNAMIEVGRKK